MTAMPEGPSVTLSCEGVYKRHVVRLNCEGGALEKMAEVTNGLVNSEQLSIESGIILLGFLQSTAEKTQGTRLSLDKLLEDSSDGDVAGICGEEKGLPRDWESEEAYPSESFFGLQKALCLRGVPHQFLGFPS